MKNAVLVYELNGGATHRFCPEAEARTFLASAQDNGEGASIFITEGFEAELFYSVAPNLRSRVDAAKGRLSQVIRIRNALDKHGVPRDRDLRSKINTAFGELNQLALA